MPSQVIASSYTDGPTLSGASAASCVPTYVPTTLPAGFFQVGRMLRLRMSGRVSCAVTTPGTFRLDMRLGGTVVSDTLAVPLNTVAQTTVPWHYDALITCRSVGSGTSATLFTQGLLSSTAFLNTAAVATGPWAGNITVPYNVAPVVGNGFNSQSALTLDFFHTQTVGTGQFILHQMMLELLT